MKTNMLIRVLLCIGILSCTSCGIVQNVEDITDNANQILEELADLSRTVNSAVETGELEDRVGTLVDARIDKLTESINEIIQENGGFIFDEVNGTLDNTFDNIRTVIDDLKTGILDESIPQNIELLSGHLERHTNNVAAHAENLINLTFGNTALIISQATDAAFTLTVWGIFGVGMLLFILFLIIWGSKMTKTIRNIVLILMALFILICGSILFVPPVKGWVLKSLNIGQEMIAKSLEPKIVSAMPNEFEFGTNNRLILFGTHLEQLSRDSVEIALYQSGSKKLVFPKSTIKVISANKIILSDFANSSLKWKKVNYTVFKSKYKTMTNKNLPTNYINATMQLNKKHILNNPAVLKSINRSSFGTVQPIAQPVSLQPATVQPLVTQPYVYKMLKATFTPQFALDYSKLLLGQFKIKPGDYEVKVTHKRTGKTLSTVQHIKFDNPPPPPPKPDIFPVSMGWVNGNPVKGTKGQLKLTLGIVHGEQAKSNMTVDLAANPGVSGLRDINVTRTALNNAANTLTVHSREFTVPRAGNFNFSARSDISNKIQESNENNNTKNQNLRVKDYKFKASVKYHTFISHKDLDGALAGDDEYRIDITTAATGKGSKKIDFNKNGTVGKSYSINKTHTFDNLKEGDKITITTSGYEADDWPSSDTNMGSDYKKYDIINANLKTYAVQLRAKHYTISGEVKVEKIVLN